MMEAKNNVTVLGILRQSLKFNAVNLFSKVISVPKGIIVAMVLVPEEYGIIGFVGLWLTYAGLINPGMDSAASREVPYLLGKGEKEKALKSQNVAITNKLLYSFLPFFVILSASFFYSNEYIRIGLIITAISYFVGVNAADNWGLFNHTRQRFNEVATGNLIKNITTVLITLTLISQLRIYAVLIAPVVASILTFIYYTRNAGIDYRFEINWKETVNLIKIGVPMALLTVIYWAYRMADSTMIAAFLPLHEMGLYYYATGMVSYAILFFSDFTSVLQPVLWTNLGESKNYIEGFKPVQRIGVYMSIATAISMTICQVGFYLLTHLITTKYVESIPVFNVLTFGIFFLAMVAVPNIILTSSVVNKQTLNTKIWAVGLALNVMLDYIIIKLGFGIMGVALVTIVVQGLILLTLFYTVRQYMFENLYEFIRFMKLISLPLLISTLLYLASTFYEKWIQNVFLYGILSSICSGFVWIIVIRLFYPAYFPKEKIIGMWREATKLVKPTSG